MRLEKKWTLELADIENVVKENINYPRNGENMNNSKKEKNISYFYKDICIFHRIKLFSCINYVSPTR